MASAAQRRKRKEKRARERNHYEVLTYNRHEARLEVFDNGYEARLDEEPIVTSVRGTVNMGQVLSRASVQWYAPAALNRDISLNVETEEIYQLCKRGPIPNLVSSWIA